MTKEEGHQCIDDTRGKGKMNEGGQFSFSLLFWGYTYTIANPMPNRWGILKKCLAVA